MAHPTLLSAAEMAEMAEMADICFEGVICPYKIYMAESKLPKAGFGLFAGDEIPAGTEVFRATPIVSAASSQWANACDNCFEWVDSSDPFKPPVNLLTCASCMRVKYCSKGCQRAAWKKYHKQECRIYTCYRSYREIDPQIVKPIDKTLATRMLLRLIVLHQHGQLTNNQWKAISALDSKKGFMHQSDELDLSADIKLLKPVTKCDMSEADLQELYWRINTNRHCVGPLVPSLGSCLVPSISLLNHSCDSNAHHLSEGIELVVRSMRKIAKGEEITISYITPFLSAEERLKALFTEYAFICQCHRCNEESEEQENLFNNSILYAQVGKAKSKLQALLKSVAVGAEELDGVETKMREICSASGRAWPMNASPLPELYEVLAETLQRQQRWEKALQICLKRVFIIDPLCLRERLNPLRVKHLIDLCQVEAQISRTSAIDVGFRASFRTIEKPLSLVQREQNIQLEQDAAASLGTNHLIYRVAAHFVKAANEQMVTRMGYSPSVLQSEPFKQMRKKLRESSELELLKWANIDLTMKTI